LGLFLVTKELADQQIIEEVLNGNKNAFSLLVSKYQYRILNVVGRFVREPADCEDVAQQAFMKAYMALPNFRGDSAFYTWLYTIAQNCAKSFVKSKSQQIVSVDANDPEVDVYDGSERLHDIESPEDLLSSQELQKLMTQALNQMPADLRQALVLCELDGLSYDEIARQMNCPVGTVKSRISRARECLGKVIRPYMDRN
jgi:RNA polymerase sigma-70 factor (ECF subfamily)